MRPILTQRRRNANRLALTKGQRLAKALAGLAWSQRQAQHCCILTRYRATQTRQQGAVLLTMIDTSLNQVDARIFWYNHVAEPGPAALMRQALAMAE